MKEFSKRADAIIADLTAKGKRESMLLHSCCGPCSTACIEYLSGVFDLTVLFYNPNIAPPEEYERRASEQARYIRDFTTGVKCEICACDPSVFYAWVRGLEDCPEGGKRCEKCFELRLDECARTAKERGFDWFCTTLTVSPHKNARMINEIGERKEREYGVKFFPSDFKKKDGYLRSIKLSEKAGLYRQNYCGCAFSLRRDKQ